MFAVKIDSVVWRPIVREHAPCLGIEQSEAGEHLVWTCPTTLAPGEKLLVPIRIGYVPQTLEDRDAVTGSLADWSSLLRTSTCLQKKMGTSGLRANQANHAVPLLKTYLFGPELSVVGLAVNGARIDLEQRSANFSDLVMSMEGLSCPDLSSWDTANQIWVEHGKVLDKAPSQLRWESERPQIVSRLQVTLPNRGARAGDRVHQGCRTGLDPERQRDDRA